MRTIKKTATVVKSSVTVYDRALKTELEIPKSYIKDFGLEIPEETYVFISEDVQEEYEQEFELSPKEYFKYATPVNRTK